MRLRRDGARVRGGGLARRAGRRGRGELAGLPEAEHVLQPGEEAGEAGHEQGRQHIPRATADGFRLRGGAQVGQIVGQGGGVSLHVAGYN